VDGSRTTIYRGVRPTLALPIGVLALVVSTLDARQPARDTVKPEERIVALDPRWTIGFATPPAATAGFDQTTGYVPLQGGQLVAVDLERGQVRWQVDLATTLTPVTGDGLVFTASKQQITAFDQRSGSTVWQTPIEADLAMAPVWDSGWLLAATTDGQVIALRAGSGAIAWRAAVGPMTGAQPAAGAERVFVALSTGDVVALELSTGQLMWKRALGEHVITLTALAEQLIVGTRENHLFSLSLERGRIRWPWRVGADVIGAVVADDDHIYYAALNNVLRALDRRNGNLRWTRSLTSRPAGGPLRTADVVIVPLVTTDMAAFAAATGAPAFTIRAAGELDGVPYLRESPRPTAPHLIAMSRSATLQGFAPRFDPVPAVIDALPGTKVQGIR
jgi:outer membrane protein assembly factor BamB